MVYLIVSKLFGQISQDILVDKMAKCSDWSCDKLSSLKTADEWIGVSLRHC